jgi:surface polysaccharide O-acyltransferase-like enzyme
VEKPNLGRGRSFPVDLIRAIAIVGVILYHAAGDWTITIQQMNQMNQSNFTSWAVVDVYQTLGRIGVPLFVMVTGALLLQPAKNESLSAFFKKRWARIGLPWIFWGGAYFAWDFLIMHIPFTSTVIVMGILDGPYSQFWYLYMLLGLYLLTPILRIFLDHADQTMIKYFVILWFLGVAVIPVFGLLSSTYQLNTNVFTITGFVGYFVLGTYLLTVQARRSTLSIFMILGIALTAIGTYVLAATVGGTEMYFFQQYLSPTLILASIMVFLLLVKIQTFSVQKEIDPSKGNKLIKIISENTLAIFLFHVIVLESLQNGYLGFAINNSTINPVIGVPLLTVIVLFVSLAIILLLKKIPYLKKLIG